MSGGSIQQAFDARQDFPPPTSFPEEAGDPGWQEAPGWGEPIDMADAEYDAAPDALPGEAGPDEWEHTTPPERSFLLQDWIIRGAAGLLGGQDGVGKSLLAQQLGTCSAAGLPFLGLPIERCRSIYITCEDPSDELHRRQETINRALGITMASLRGWFKTYSLKGELGNELGVFDGQGRLSATARYEQVRRAALDFGAELVFVDNAAHVFSGNENARHDVAAFLGLLERLSVEINGAVILLAHPNKQHAQGNKQGNEYSGSTGWSAHVRNRLFLDWNAAEDGMPADADERVLRRSKSNYAAKGAEIIFRWHQWAFVRAEDLSTDYQAELAGSIKVASENARFLKCLAICTEQERAVSHVKGTNYAPKIFAGMVEGRGFKPAEYAAAMERLLHLGQIELNKPLWQDAHRHWKQGIRLAEKCGDPPAATPCGDLRQPPSETRRNPCGEVRAATPLYTTYKGGASEAAPPQQDDDLDWSESEGPSDD